MHRHRRHLAALGLADDATPITRATEHRRCLTPR
jgi:hypothetical protein